MVRDKPGHRAAIVSIQLESCKIRTLISCSRDSTIVGYQQIKVTSKAGRPRGTLCSSKGGDQLQCTAELVVSVLVLQLGIGVFGRSSKSTSL